MNKKLIALLLMAVMLLSVGCGNDAEEKETTAPSQSVETSTQENVPGETSTQESVPEETILGVENLDDPVANPFDETQDDGKDNSGSSNTGSQGNNGNTGNTGSNGSTGSQGNTGSSGTEQPTQSGGETATEPKPTEPKPTEPKPTEPKPTEPKPTEPGETEPDSDIHYVSYEEYINMTPEEQVEYYNQFPSMEAFIQWYNEAKAKYDEENGAIDVGDGEIDLGDIVKP